MQGKNQEKNQKKNQSRNHSTSHAKKGAAKRKRHIFRCVFLSSRHQAAARSRAPIRSKAENCHRRNSFPPLNDEMVRGLPRQAEAQNKATVFCRKLSLYFGGGDAHSPITTENVKWMDLAGRGLRLEWRGSP